jgi:hypothetical protein
MGYLSNQKKLHKLNNHPLGEKMLNLVTLAVSLFREVQEFRQCSLQTSLRAILISAYQGKQSTIMREKRMSNEFYNLISDTEKRPWTS